MNFRALQSKLVGISGSAQVSPEVNSGVVCRPGSAPVLRWLGILMLAGFGLLPLSAQETPPLLEAGKVQVTASAERSTLNRVTGVLTSAVDIEATNVSGQRIDGPVHAIIAFKTPEGVEVREAVTVPGALGGFGRDPWQQPFFDLTAQLGPDGWQPGTVLRLPLGFSRARTLSVLYEVTFAGRVNHEPVVNPGGPYTGRVGSEITFTGAATDPDGDPLTFTWDFGSGAGAPTAEASRAFATAGVPRVTLTVNDGRGGVVVREVTVLVAPPGNFALAHTRVVDGTGHPLAGAQVTENGPLGSREFAAGDEGFVSLGLTAGNYGWTFSAPGHRPVHRQASLLDGGIRLLPSPWLAREGGPAEVSVLEPTTLIAGNNAVRLIFPAGAFTQPGAARLTPLGPQTLPFPLPFGWSPLAAFHLDLPEIPTLPGAARLRLAELVAVGEILTLVRFDETARVWRVIKTGQADPARRDEFNFSLGESGTVAALVRDAGPGAPPIGTIGDPLPAGTPQNLESLVTAVGSVTPQEKRASLDPDAVTAVGEAVFTPATGVPPSGSWFRLGVQETYDLTDGTGLRTPDYDATMYAYRRPGPGGSTVRAAFPLRPRLLFGPADLKEARVHVEVLPPLGDGPAALSEAGGSLGSGGFQVVIPPNALGGVAVGSLRSLGASGFAGLAGPGFVVTGAFELNLAGLAPGTVLDFSMTTPVAPGADFILAKLVSFSGGSGLAPVQRLRSNAAGVLTNAEPDSAPRLPGLTGPGQYLLVQLPAAQGLVSGLVRTSAAVPVPGIGTRVTGQPWLSVTGADGSYFLTFPAGEGTVLASNSANGDGAAASFTMPAALAAQTVDLTLGALAPRVLAVTPPDKALKVAVVTPLTVEFSEKIAPASLGATPLTLRAAGATTDVPVGFTLELSNRIITLLPVNPLEPATVYTLTVSEAIRDLQNLALDGPREFTFTTAAPAARGEGAQLVIYEPGGAGPTPADQALIDAIPGYTPGTDAGKVVAIGSAGSADPSVPVILVNESTGTTATVLSKTDGSFANCIDAAEEDFISAVFVNANGTRITIPATRQLFDDGRVGLYRQGGILEAENLQDDAPPGSIQVLVESDAIDTRTVFRLESASPAALQQLLANNPPVSGNIPGAFTFQVTSGTPPTEAPVVVFPATRQQLGLTPEDDPAQHSFALCESAIEDGVPYYNIVDRMKYEDGKLITSSPPYPGLASGAISSILMVPLRMAFGYRFTAAGRVLAGRAADLPVGGQISEEEGRNLRLSNGAPLVTVPGAIVLGSSGGTNNTSNRLVPGAFAAKANNNGFYAVLIPYNPLSPDAIRLSALHPALPNLTASGALVPNAQDSVALPVEVKNLVFSLPDGAAGDFSAPVIQADPGQAVLPVGTPFNLMVRVEDGVSTPRLVSADFDPIQSQADNPATVLGSGSVLVAPVATTPDGDKAVNVELKLTAFEPMRAGLRLTATDEAGNTRTRVVFLRFGAPPPVDEDLEAVDDGDTTGPMLTGSIPARGVPLNRGIVTLYFNEPLGKSCLDPSAVTATGAVIGRRALSSDQRSLTLALAAIQNPVALNDANLLTSEISLEFNPSFVTDLSGNSLTGDNMLVFPQLPQRAVDLEETENAVAVTSAGNCVVTLRNLGSEGRIVIHAAGAGTGTVPLGSALTPAFPRAMVFMPAVTYFLPDKAPPPFYTIGANENPLTLPGQIKTSDLLAVTGGLTGEEQLGPWLRVFDISDPVNPVRLATSLVSGDFTSVASMLKWSPPKLHLGMFTTEGGQVMGVNLQGFLIGCQSYSRGQYGFGLDLNADTDYVDAGERPPVPKHNTLFGLEDILSSPNKESFNDFAVLGGGGTVVAVTRAGSAQPARLLVLRAPGVVINSGEGKLDLPDGTYRVLLDPAFPLEDATGTRPVPVALLVARNQFLVVSLLDPQHPVVVRQFTLAAEGATIFSLVEINRNELVIAATDGTRVLSRAALGAMEPTNPVMEITDELVLSGGRSIGASVDALATYSSAGTRLLRRLPGIGVVQFPGDPVRSMTTIMNMDGAGRADIFDRATERGFLRPILGGGNTPGMEGIDPPEPEAHHYVLVRASGAFGSVVRVGVQSLSAAEAAADISPCPTCCDGDGDAPDVIFFDAKRLSDDPKHPLYNQFLAGPFAIFVKPLRMDQALRMTAVEGRQFLGGGEQIRAFLAPDSRAHAELLPNVATESGGSIKPKVASTYLSMKPEYVDSPNPSGRSAPRLMGGMVDLQSGEVTLSESDVMVEGRHQDLVFKRIYQSRSHYDGVLGRNWDHTFNARIQEFSASQFPGGFSTLHLDRGFDALTIKTGDVILIDGAGTTHLFKLISEANGNNDKLSGYNSDTALREFWGTDAAGKIRAYYDSPGGVFAMLVQLKDLKWVLIGTQGHRTYFNPNGSLDRLVGARKASVITCHYRSKDGLLGEVRGDNGGRIRFGYYYPFLDPRRTGPIDPPVQDAGKCGKLAVVHGQLSAGPGGQRVEFDYDEDGNLISAEPSWRKPMIYGYDQAEPGLVTRFGEVDSTQYPSATLTYELGMLKSIDTAGESLQVTGAVATARERHEGGAKTVSLGPLNGPTAEIPVDTRGQPTGFGGRAISSDASGQIQSFGALRSGITLVYDTNNPVRRFRGNLIRTERRALNGGPPIVSSTVYDDGPFNRPVSFIDTNGVSTELTHLAGEVREVTGGIVTKQTLINNFGQKTSENRSGGQTPVSVQHSLDVVTGLPSGTIASTTATLARDDIGRIDENRQGAVGSTHQFNPTTGDLMSIVPVNPAVQPRMDWTYDADGRAESQTVAGAGKSIRTAFTYSEENGGRPASLTITESGLPVTTTSNTHDDSGRLLQSVVDGVATDIAYTGPIVTSVNSPGLKRELTLVNGSDVSSITENGVTTSFGYDTVGRVLTVQTGGKRTTMLYDESPGGNPRERPAGKVISAAPGVISPPSPITETNTYDQAGRLERIVSSNGRTREFVYHADGRLRQALINGRVTRQIDVQQDGNVTAITLGNLRRALGGFNANTGRAESETISWTDSGKSMTVNYTHDAAGRLLASTYPDGSYTSAYDVFGNITSRTDPDGAGMTFDSAPSGLPLSATFADGTSVSYSVGPGRRRERMNAASGNQTMTYVDDRLAGIQQPDGTFQNFGDYNIYQGAETITIGSVVQTLGYDDMGRVISITSPVEDTEWQRGFDAFDRLAFVELGSEKTLYQYNALDSLAGETTESGGLEIGRWTVERDATERTLAETYPSGLRLEFAPDDFGQPTGVAASNIQGITWHGLGMPGTIRYLSGVEVESTYDASFRVSDIEYRAPGGAVAAGFSYTLTPGGRVLSETRVHDGRRDEFDRNTVAEAMRIVDFRFGLPTTVAPGVTPAPQAFVNGFSFAKGELLGPASTSSPGIAIGDARGFFPALQRVNGSNRLASIDGVAVSYNDRGSMQSFPVWVHLPGNAGMARVLATATWDAAGNLVRIERDDGVTVEYTRDGNGRIAVREVAGPSNRCAPSSTRYFWAGERLLEERAVAAGLPLLRRYHYLAGKLTLMEAANSAGDGMDAFIPLVSLNGSVGGFLDMAGTLRHVIRYGAYGLPVLPGGDAGLGASAVDSPLLFHGAFYDKATGLSEMGERHLHPLTGGFLERDSELGKESLAWFTAFNGDPAGRIDPFGQLSNAVDSLASVVDFAQKAKPLYAPAMAVKDGTYENSDGEEEEGKIARFKSGVDLVTAGLDLYLSNQDDDTRKRWSGVTENLGKAKDIADKFKSLEEAIGGDDDEDDAGDEAEEDTKPWSSEARWGWLQDGSDMLLMPSLSEDAMGMKSIEMQTFANTKLAGAGMPEAPDFEDAYGDAVEARMEKIGKAKIGLAGLQVGLEFLEPEFLKDPHNKAISDQAFKVGQAALDFAGKVAENRGERALVALRANPIEALGTSFDFGFELGKFGIIALSDPDVAKDYEAQVKKFEDDGGWLTVGSGILATFGADDTALLIQSIADREEIDVLGSIQTVFENALAERERRQMLTEFYLRGISAP